MAPPRSARAEADLQLAQALQSFADSRSAIEDTVTLMREQQEAEHIAAKQRRKYAWIGALVGLVIVVAVVVILSLVGLDQSRSNGETLDKVEEVLVGVEDVLKRFDECTTPGTENDPHECYDRSQSQTAQAVLAIQQTNIKAAAYAVECVLGGRADVEECVQERFAGSPSPPVQQQSSTTTTTRASRSSPPTSATTTTTAAPTTTSSPPATFPPQFTTTTSTTIDACEVKLAIFCLQVGEP